MALIDVLQDALRHPGRMIRDVATGSVVWYTDFREMFYQRFCSTRLVDYGSVLVRGLPLELFNEGKMDFERENDGTCD